MTLMVNNYISRVNIKLLIETKCSAYEKYNSLSRVNKFFKLMTDLQCFHNLCVCGLFKSKITLGSISNGRDCKEEEMVKSILQSSCQVCGHTGADHGKTLDLKKLSLNDEKILDKLQLSLDHERMVRLHAAETDQLIKDVYRNLQVILKAQLYEQSTEDVYHLPPFEFPSIDYYVYNFVCYKYKKSPSLERMLACAKYFINSLNNLNLTDHDSKVIRDLPTFDQKLYKSYYELWLVYCMIPRYVLSLKSYPMTQIFGYSMLEILSSVAFDYILREPLIENGVIKSDYKNFVEQLKNVISTGILKSNNFVDSNFIFHYKIELYNSPFAKEKILNNGRFVLHDGLMIRDFLVMVLNCNTDDNGSSASYLTSSSSGSSCEDEDDVSVIDYKKQQAVKSSKKRVVRKRKGRKSRVSTDRVIRLRKRTIVIDSDREELKETVPCKKVRHVEADSGVSEPSTSEPSTSVSECDSTNQSPECALFYEHIQFSHEVQMEKTVKSKMKVLLLSELQNLISKQLPKMGSDYVGDIIFDPYHHSIVLIKNRSVIGGITFRIFAESKFVEITFCAIKSREQVKGYGTLLMDLLKQYCLEKNIKHFLTYADEFAVGYFCKQGFTTNITVPKQVYTKFIEEYQFAMLMECKLNPHVGIGNPKLSQVKVLTELMSNAAMVSGMKKKVTQRDISDLVASLSEHPKCHLLLKYGTRLRQSFENCPDFNQIASEVKLHRYRNLRMVYFDLLRVFRHFQFTNNRRSKFYKNALFIERKMKKVLKDLFGIEELF